MKNEIIKNIFTHYCIGKWYFYFEYKKEKDKYMKQIKKYYWSNFKEFVKNLKIIIRQLEKQK